MTRTFPSALLALSFSVLSLAAPVSAAWASQIHFRAQPETAPSEARLVVRDTVFRCGAAGCVAPRGASRAELVCAALAREVGGLESFSANGRLFDPAALAECNRRAR